MMIAALVDLQAFVPDDDAVLVRHWDANGDQGQSAIGVDKPRQRSSVGSGWRRPQLSSGSATIRPWSAT